MADAEKIMQGLARLAVEHPGCDGVISDAIALIERLTKPMTLERAIEILNAKNHLFTSEWRIMREIDSDGDTLVESDQGTLTAFEAKAIARAYEAEKEAARA